MLIEEQYIQEIGKIFITIYECRSSNYSWKISISRIF